MWELLVDVHVQDACLLNIRHTEPLNQMKGGYGRSPKLFGSQPSYYITSSLTMFFEEELGTEMALFSIS